MIPKIAWIHWHDPDNMPWLRAQSVRTFRKHNPDWDVRVIGTPPDIEARGLKHHAQAADLTRWRTLAEHGGFMVDSDVISLKPIPDEWLDADTCAQVKNGDVYQMAVLGVIPKHPMMVELAETCDRNTDSLLEGRGDVYQAFGVDMMRYVNKQAIHRHGKLFNIPWEAFCFYDWNMDPRAFWTTNGPARSLPPEAIGVHWYGGHIRSIRKEPDAGPDGMSWIERLAVAA